MIIRSNKDARKSVHNTTHTTYANKSSGKYYFSKTTITPYIEYYSSLN